MGLVAYASSDEESDHEAPPPKAKAKAAVIAKEAIPEPAPPRKTSQDEPAPDATTTSPAIISPIPIVLPQLRPQLGPQPAPRGPSDLIEPLPEPDNDQDLDLDHPNNDGDGGGSGGQQNPSRSLIHSLTLPSVPDLAIPPSPSSSPPPLLTSKLQTFLALKRKGTHFNSKLLASESLRNPSLMDKLLAYVDIDDAGQYETTLSSDLWDANAFPEWAYRDRLRKTREKIAKKKEAERAAGVRTVVDFVPSVNASGAEGAGSVGGSRTG